MCRNIITAHVRQFVDLQDFHWGQFWHGFHPGLRLPTCCSAHVLQKLGIWPMIELRFSFLTWITWIDLTFFHWGGSLYFSLQCEPRSATPCSQNPPGLEQWLKWPCCCGRTLKKEGTSHVTWLLLYHHIKLCLTVKGQTKSLYHEIQSFLW